MIINYRPKYKRVVTYMITAAGSFYNSAELYVFDTYGEVFSKSSFLYVKGGTAAGFIGVIACAENKSLHIYSLCVNNQYKKRGIDKMLIERVVIYAYENGYKTISFLVNSSNRRNYDLFSDLAKRLNKHMESTSRHVEATFLEITYTIFLDRPSDESGCRYNNKA